ncbi:MAG: uracil-DNA glycosylase [Deltaproteobacteria bacterium]|nr:MAG: uracil-DNA glycosylase [Deltaproteobacteria bacterium]
MAVDCRKCEHYYVSWDKNFPHGCRSMGFKSRQLPAVAVRKATPDMDCQSFRERGKKSGGRRNRS